MKKFKTNKEGFLDSSYNFEEVKNQFQQGIKEARNKLKQFREGEDYIISYEDNGQKKIYFVNSLNMKRVYWGDNILDGFDYFLEESEKGVSAKMKMTDLGVHDYSQRSIEGFRFIDSQDNSENKIDILREELRQKEQDISLLANHPEKQRRLRIEVENIKSSIDEIINQSRSEQNIQQVEQSSNSNNGGVRGGWKGYGGSGFFGSLSLLSLLFFLV